MGRTIKISELKKFDVFTWDEIPDRTYVYCYSGHCLDLEQDVDLCFWKDDYNKEVTVLGRMEFKEE